MKSRKLLIGLLTFMLTAGVFTLTNSSAYGQFANKATVNGIGDGFDNGWNYMSALRNNQVTGTLNPNDVLNAMNQVSATRSTDAIGLNWSPLGPDNYAGRTRAILLSNKDAQYKTLYAGSVSGGLWKSTTAGLTWNQIITDGIILNVSTMAQAPNGDIYVGTGESFSSDRFNKFSGFIGQGIYKSTDGNSFVKLTSTDPGTFNDATAEWAFINKIAAGTNNMVYAATNSGLKISADGGQTWVKASAGGVELTSASTEVDVATDGTVIASVGNQVYKSANGAADNFVLISGGEGETALPHAGMSRIELAFAPSDPNYIYAVLVGDGTQGGFVRGQLAGIYVSKDKGATWRLVGPGASIQFNVFGNAANTTHYGDYVASVIVNDTNPDMVFVGGVNLWAGAKVLETGFYQWQQMTAGPANRFHNVLFDPIRPLVAYMATDQGLYTTNDYFFNIIPLNRNYRTSMFYSVAADDKGRVMGGTQGNGVLFIDKEGNSEQAALQIYPGFVGGSVEFSMINPEAIFYSSTAGLMERSGDLGEAIANEFVGTDISNANTGVFNTPIRIYENFNNTKSLDSVTYIAEANHAAGDIVTVRSKSDRFPFNHTLAQAITKGDSVKVQDIITSRFFVGVTNAVYMTKEVLNMGAIPTWWKIANITGIPTTLAYSKDANFLFVGTQEGKVYRIANLAMANTGERADVSNPTCIVSTTLIEDFAGRYVTSIAVDQRNDGRIVVTLGNYGNNEFVFMSANALDLEPSFISIQGNLPKMPVYSSLFELTTSNLLIGTDFGVYTATSLNANTNWTAENQGMGALPIMAIRQQTVTRPITESMGPITNTGAIYLASHGNGIFENRMYVGMGELPQISKRQTELVSVYPNPVKNTINFLLSTEKSTTAVAKVYDLRGNIVIVKDLGTLMSGANKVTIQAEQLKPGSYLMQVIMDNQVLKAKFVVVK